MLQASRRLCPAAAAGGGCTAAPHLLNIPASLSTSLWQTLHMVNLKNDSKPFIFSPIVFERFLPSSLHIAESLVSVLLCCLYCCFLPLFSCLLRSLLLCIWFYAVLIPFPFLMLVGLYCIKHNTDSFFVDICGMRYGNTLFRRKFSSKDYPSWVKWLFPLFQINHARKEIFHASLLPLIFQGAPLNENPLFCLTERDTNTSYLV